MDYDTLVSKISEETGYDEKTIREILSAMPPILMELEEGSIVQTPLGSFFGKVRKSKPVRLMSGEWVDSTPRFVINLRPGKQMVKDLNPDQETNS